MTTPALARLETTNRVRKRAQYEAFEFSVDQEGVLIRNGSYADPENHEYLVTVTDGLPTDCECPANANYDGACKHRVAVAIRRPVLDALENLRQTQKPHSALLTDGGSQADTADGGEQGEDNAADPACDCAALPEGFPCWECVRTGRRELPQ
ncbi:SWIM zinc finger family protein [Natronoarchaeum rubrum]|uniref:SWIM zinc finger family protein n=1 Tax=Natronoarchaeum rubrum TaxID=755311 RepID=UPI0021126E60|nr:SWIM zinc finger family protein [Natronoarchaeum rubrum]